MSQFQAQPRNRISKFYNKHPKKKKNSKFHSFNHNPETESPKQDTPTSELPRRIATGAEEPNRGSMRRERGENITTVAMMIGMEENRSWESTVVASGIAFNGWWCSSQMLQRTKRVAHRACLPNVRHFAASKIPSVFLFFFLVVVVLLWEGIVSKTLSPLNHNAKPFSKQVRSMSWLTSQSNEFHDNVPLNSGGNIV